MVAHPAERETADKVESVQPDVDEQPFDEYPDEVQYAVQEPPENVTVTSDTIMLPPP